MRRFTVSVIALVLAVGLSSARPDIELSNYPIFVGDTLEEEVSRPRPVPTFPEFAPEINPDFELEPVSENEEVIPPILISLNPCDACFEYMTALIDQLTEVAVPEVPEVGRPLPIPNPGGELRPLPLPISPEIDTRPLPAPIPSEAEAEEVLANQNRPLPTHIIR